LSYFVMPFSIILLFAVAFYTAPKASQKACKEEVMLTQVSSIITNRCITCHSSKPTDLVWQVAPNGVVFDTPEQILNMKDGIYQRVVLSQNMPFNNNQTNMLQEERDLIECWILQGAKK